MKANIEKSRASGSKLCVKNQIVTHPQALHLIQCNETEGSQILRHQNITTGNSLGILHALTRTKFDKTIAQFSVDSP